MFLQRGNLVWKSVLCFSFCNFLKRSVQGHPLALTLTVVHISLPHLTPKMQFLHISRQFIFIQHLRYVSRKMRGPSTLKEFTVGFKAKTRLHAADIRHRCPLEARCPTSSWWWRLWQESWASHIAYEVTHHMQNCEWSHTGSQIFLPVPDSSGLCPGWPAPFKPYTFTLQTSFINQALRVSHSRVPLLSLFP